MRDSIDTIISNALTVKKDNLGKNIKSLINQIQKSIENNKELITQANEIDKKNNNGFIIDFEIINNIFSNLKEETVMYGNVTLSQKDNYKKIIYGKEILDCGNVVVVNDGNTYVIIEMILRNIMARNTTIFSNNGFMYGTNGLIMQIIKSVLEQFNVSKNLIQMFISEDFDDILSNYANIDLVVCIGDSNLQNLILRKTKNRTIVSGYENFDIYIEDDSHFEFLNKIVNTGLNVNIYINNNTNLEHSNAIYVDDIEEAIAKINYNSSRYSSSIFTKSTENASKFIKEVKSKIVTINTSPTIERIIDIKQSDLVNEKTIIYPLSFKFDGGVENIKL